VKGVVSNLHPETETMNRIVILAAATALCAGSASAQQSIHIATAGKSPDQIRAEVFKAAKRVCSLDIVGASFPIDEMRACVDATMRQTLSQAPDLKLARR